MSTSERPPTADELLAMAYADGELSPEASRAFEERTRREPALAREVVALRRLQILAREAAGPEPMDGEWERIARSPVHRASLGLGVALAMTGILGLAAWAIYVLWSSDVPLVPKLCITAFVAGFAVLFWRTYHARARTLPYDAYTKVKR